MGTGLPDGNPVCFFRGVILRIVQLCCTFVEISFCLVFFRPAKEPKALKGAEQVLLGGIPPP